MPPVLSKGGAASKLSATEPASVWAPSPDTNCEQAENQVSQRDELNTQEGKKTPTHRRSGQHTHAPAPPCLHWAGWYNLRHFNIGA